MGVVWENKLDDKVFWHIVGAHQTSIPFPSKVSILTLFLMLEGCWEHNNEVYVKCELSGMNDMWRIKQWRCY